jgi:hypothetical protein
MEFEFGVKLIWMAKKIIFLLLFFLFTISLARVSYSQTSFNNAYIRLDKSTINAPLSGTICAQPSSNGTVNKVTITFPNTFTISSNVNTWATNVNDLPVGATVWPGIGNPSISGKTATFSSGNLVVGILYCFNFSSTSSTTGAAGNNQTGTIATKNSSNAIISSTTYALSIVGNNQINITATVPPQANALPVSIESLVSGSQFPQRTTLPYKITYGSLAASSFPLTIQAQWAQGTIEGNPTPSVDILDYAIGSASNAYNSTPAIVDTVNNTITWIIPSFPANTLDKSVTFNLITNNSYTGFSKVSFAVSARAISGSTVTPDKTVTQNYLYNASLEPTPTPIPAPTSTPTPTNNTTGVTATPTPSPTPAPNAEAPAFSAITVQSLSQSDAQIAINTSLNSIFNLRYGTSPNLLSQSITSLTALSSNAINLPELTPDTNYYFKVVAKDANGRITGSDTFTFRTAVVSDSPLIDQQSFLATSNNSVLVNAATPATGQTTGKQPINNNSLAIPQSSTFDIQFNLKKYVAVKTIQAIVKNKVLGANTFLAAEAEASTSLANLVEVSPGVYSGRLKTLPAPGTYEIFIRIVDYNGNIVEQKLADLVVTSKFTVYDKTTKKGIENARALLYLYNAGTRTYEIISPQLLPISNPVFSQADGQYEIVLPYGKYRADISAIGYKNQTIEFAITQRGGYPPVYLTPSSSLISIAQYYLAALSDALISSQIYIQQQAKSSRLFDLSAVGAVIFLVGITILSISARTHIAIIYLPYFLYFKLNLLFRKDKARIIFGRVIDEKTGTPISRANIYLSTPDGKHVLVSLITNKLGEFYYNNPKGLDYRITVIKEGYSLPDPWDFVNNKVKQIPTVLEMEEQVRPHLSLLTITTLYAEDFLGMCMEALVIFGILIQIYFVFTFGILRVIPIICITIINVMLILTYLYRPRGL